MSGSIERIDERHPLPWEYRDYNMIGAVLDADERLVFFSSVKDNLNRTKTLRFLISRANLMPEITTVLKEVRELLNETCSACGETDAAECATCPRGALNGQIMAILAKLKEGATDEAS